MFMLLSLGYSELNTDYQAWCYLREYSVLKLAFNIVPVVPGWWPWSSEEIEIESQQNLWIRTGRYGGLGSKQADWGESSEWDRGMQMLSVWQRRDPGRYQSQPGLSSGCVVDRKPEEIQRYRNQHQGWDKDCAFKQSRTVVSDLLISVILSKIVSDQIL